MKKALKIILIILGVLFVPILLVVFGTLLGFLIWDTAINKDISDNKREIFSYVIEHKADAVDPNQALAFYHESSGLLEYTLDQGYYFSPDDTYWIVDADIYSKTASCEEPLSRKAAKRYRKGYRTEDRYYTEKICDNWYYFECLADD